MRRLTIALLATAATISFTFGLAAGAQASVPCSKGTKVIPADKCAFLNMVEAANHQGVGNPTFKSFYVAQTSIGKFHSVWTGLIHYPGKPIRFTLTARRCGNTYVTFNHRKGTWWPRYC